MERIRCGVVSYANAAPLWAALRDDPRWDLVPANPDRLAGMLQAGELDVGLLPVIEYFRNPGVRLVDGIGIAAKGTVRSVRLFCKRPVRDIRSVRLDGSSRTSAALVQILLRDRHGISPTFVTGVTADQSPERIPEDAALIIGDPCLRALIAAEWDSVDLAEEWLKLTGLPFVFAAWLLRPGLSEEVSGDIALRLHDAAAWGTQNLPAIAAEWAGRERLDRFALLDYLQSNIRYVVGDDELAGLEEFARRAGALGLCEARVLDVVAPATV